MAAQRLDVVGADTARVSRDLFSEDHHRDLARCQTGAPVVARDRLQLLAREDAALEQHGSMGKRSVAAPELRRGGDGDQLVAALIHRGAYRRDQAAPGRANLGPECQDLRVVRDIAERLEIALVGLLELASGLLERDLLDERHVGSPLRWWTGTVRGARVSRPGVPGRRLRPSSDPTRAPRAPPPARRPLRACSTG